VDGSIFVIENPNSTLITNPSQGLSLQVRLNSLHLILLQMHIKWHGKRDKQAKIGLEKKNLPPSRKSNGPLWSI
jgi:hypothetical protein